MKRILSIEDNAQLTMFIQFFFERHGYKVVGLSKGKPGLELIRSLNPDLLLLDLMLPDIDGWEIYRLMKEDNQLCKIPIIVASARNESQDAKLGKKVMGDDRFLRKPFSNEELLATVQELLAKADARQLAETKQ